MSGEPGVEELRVLCSESELQEYGEVIRVGEQVSREAGRREGAFYGGPLDEVEWQFNQYAQAIGYEATTISGRITAIHAVYVNLTLQPDGWAPRPDSAHLEPSRTRSPGARPRRRTSRATPTRPGIP